MNDMFEGITAEKIKNGGSIRASKKSVVRYIAGGLI